MSVSQILYMYITSLINVAFKHNEHENQDMLKIINKKACKYKQGVRDSHQTQLN